MHISQSFVSNRSANSWLKIALASLLVFSLMMTPVMAESESPPLAETPELTSESAAAFLEEFFASPHVSNLYQGAAVTIVKDGEVLVQEGFGLADVSNNEPVDPDKTVFRVASVSKSITAVAAMQLVEQGLIDLDADIRAYLGDIEFENPFETPVTVGHLLSHTTGFEIRDPSPTDIHTNLDQFVEIEDYVRAHMPPVVREPGTSYMYDNFASLLVGLVVQNVSEQPFQTYMEQHIFKPLGMDHSGFLLEGDLKENLATGYGPTGEALDLYTVTPTVMPHGGMLTTASDMGKFMVAFLNGGEGESTRILSKQSVEEMIKYRKSIHALLPNTTYGFESARQLPYAGSSDQIITKAGDLGGFSSYLWFIPEENTGVFITYNNNGGLRDLLYPAFISQFFPQYATPAEPIEFTPSPEQDLSRFEGYYVDLRSASIVNTVRIGEDGNLIISNAFLGELPVYQVDHFLFGDLNGMLFGFQQNEEGSINYMDEPYLNPLGYAKKAPTAIGFSDIDADHPYSEYIHGLQSLGLYPNDAIEAFEPDRPVTRAEYIRNIIAVSGLKGIDAESTFTDIDGHPAAPEIQLAFQLGLIQGNGQGQFEPDRIITRQEAAVIVWRSYMSLYPPNHFESVQLAGETDAWAEQAVQMMVGLGLYGPEVEIDSDGAVDFRSKQPMLRQEEAAHHYLLLTKPTLNVQPN